MTEGERVRVSEQAQQFLRVLFTVLKTEKPWASVTVRVEDGKLQWPIEVRQTVK